jgi:hypothetical protein
LQRRLLSAQALDFSLEAADLLLEIFHRRLQLFALEALLADSCGLFDEALLALELGDTLPSS